MSVSSTAFKRWLSAHDLPGGALPLANLVGVGRMTVHRQLVGGRVREGLVIAAARTAGLDPVAELSTFDEYDELQRGMRPPLPVEVVSQITLTDAMVEMMRRQNRTYGDLLAGVYAWQDPPQPDGLRCWIDAVDPGHLRRELADRLGMMQPQVSREITNNSMKPRHLVEAARLAHTSLTSGLAAAGVITLQEAGWPAAARSHEIKRLSDLALNELLQARLASAHRVARRRADDGQQARHIEDTLG